MPIRPTQFPAPRIAWGTLGALLVSAGAWAAGPGQSQADREAQYLRDRQACESGQTGQDLQTCLREAGAVRTEAPRPQPPSDPGTLQRNATQRCDTLPADRQAECRELMLSGQAREAGSVPGGGVLREMTVPEPAPAQPAAPGAGMPPAPAAPGAAMPPPQPLPPPAPSMAPGTQTAPGVLPATPVAPR